ncbi:hypothetical protein ALC60_01697 [Trachymyrmex zeteki]|uniref:Uncharacterized protein n=1 Tax=Mycetomoellerius zeteki TaxID=64791 RepID=A0A151XG61_9HYME|nr:PREDICTED: uncharacterized protein LOC108731172 [Trachymyrmex zeteki]KYQ59270.1 hypothetical protein ALC60_01697 [Trachymyrmex zeteki]
MAHPTSASSSITRSIIPKVSTVQIIPKTMSLLIKPQTLAYASVITSTRGSTQYLTTSVPLDSLPNKSGSFRIQPQAITYESPSITGPITNSMQHTPTIVPSLDSSITDSSDDEKKNTSVINKDGHFIWNHKTIMLFFTEYEQHEKKLQKKKYQSKEAMFQALAESFQKKGYVNATKNHMKNKFKLLKKKWDKYILRTMRKNSSGRGIKPLSYENEMISIFGKNLSGVPPYVTGRNEIVSQKVILQKVGQTSSENENEEQSSIKVHSPLSMLSAISSKSQSMANSNCSSLINTKAKIRDGKLSFILQSIRESICNMQQEESDAKQEICTKMLVELQKCNERLNVMNELQKERNIILQRQLQVLERLEKKMYLTQKELSDEELQD